MRYMGECTGFSSTDPRLEGLVGAPSTREPGPMFAVELHGRGATVGVLPRGGRCRAKDL